MVCGNQEVLKQFQGTEEAKGDERMWWHRVEPRNASKQAETHSSWKVVHLIELDRSTIMDPLGAFCVSGGSCPIDIQVPWCGLLVFWSLRLGVAKVLAGSSE
jgi:hypothetical protein